MIKNSPTWYYHRLRSMSFPELFYRTRNLILNQAEKHLTAVFDKNNNSFCILPTKGDFFSRFFLQLDKREEVTAEFRELYPNQSSQIISAANKILEHHFKIFDCKNIQFNGVIDWHRDFKTNKNWPKRFHADMNVYDEYMGGPKYVWELNRHQHLVTLAKAYYLTDDEKYADEILRQIDSWIYENPPFYGINWCSALEVSIRLISWVWTLGFIFDSKCLTSDRQNRIMASINLQIKFVHRYLSKYSSANNHLIGEAAGIFIIGVIFSNFTQSKNWVQKAKKILEREALIQINPDGTPAEQATQYLLFVLDFYFLVIRLAQRNNIQLSPEMLDRIMKACEFLEQLQDNKGNLPLFGDNDNGRASFLSERSSHHSFIRLSNALLNRVSKKSEEKSVDEHCFWLLWPNHKRTHKTLLSSNLERESCLFEKGGIGILRKSRGKISLYVDCGQLGFGRMAAHGHADALSIVLHVDGKPIFVDPGTYLYHAAGNWRNYFRGTSAHNTIGIDGFDQSLITGTFMWAKHYNCRILSFESNERKDRLVIQHDGYMRLKDPVLHRRSIRFEKARNVIYINDIIECKGKHLVVQYFHLAPECEVNETKCNTWIIKRESIKVKLVCSKGFHSELIRGAIDPPLGWYSKNFGQKEPTAVLRQTSEILGTNSFRSEIEIQMCGD